MGNTQAQNKFSSLEEIPWNHGNKNLYTIYQGVLSSQLNKNVTVFEFKMQNNQKQDQNVEKIDDPFIVQCARHAFRIVKQLRHPSVIKFVDSLEVTENHFFLATEPVIPLSNVLPSLEYQEILLGLIQIANAIHWLNKNCQMVHNNIHLGSIYVSKDKHYRWLLGDFQFMCPIKDLTKEFLEKTKDIRAYQTPDENKKEIDISDARDIWAFGKCISDILIQLREVIKKKGTVDGVEKQFVLDANIKKWIENANNNIPSKRPSLEQFLKLPVFLKDPFCYTMLFFDGIRVKETSRKDQFFRQLFARLQQVPVNVLKKRVIPRMLTLPFITEPTASSFLPHLFTQKGINNEGRVAVSGLLDEEDYKQYILPFINKGFSSKNLSLRIKLLQHLDYYIWHLDKELVIKKIIPDILLGLRDSSDDLIMFTIDALVRTTRYLSSLDQKQNTNNIQSIANRYLEILHHYVVTADTNIAIRSHSLMSLIEMWNIPKIQKAIIFSALHYAIYDTEYEIKLYALNAILIHMERFDPREYVSLILKNIIPLALHEKIEVRNKAFQVIRRSIDHIQEYDLSKCNFGMVSRNDDPSKYAIQPYFPPSSKLPIERKSYFAGSGPSISYGLPIDNSEAEHPSPSNSIAINNTLLPENTTHLGITTHNMLALNSEIIHKRSDSMEKNHSSLSSPITTTDRSARERIEDLMNSADVDEEWEEWGDDEDNEEDINDNTEPPNITPTRTPHAQLISESKVSPTISKAPTMKSKEKEVKIIEEDEYTAANDPDYFSELGMDKPLSINTNSNNIKPAAKNNKDTKKPLATKNPNNSTNNAKKSSTDTAPKKAELAHSIPEQQDDSEEDTRPMNVEIKYEDTSLDDVNTDAWAIDDLDIDISDTNDNQTFAENELTNTSTEEIQE